MDPINITASVTDEIPLLISALGALSAVIALFWKIINSNHQETKARGDKLETKLEENNSLVIKLTDEMGDLRGRISIAEEISPKLDQISKGVSDLSSSVLEAINKS